MGQEKYTAKTMAALQAAQQMAAMRYHSLAWFPTYIGT